MHGGAKLLRAFLIALVAVGLPACHADEDSQAVSSSTQVSEAPDATPAAPDPAPAAPDPAPAAPDPAPAPPAPDPATQEDPTLPLPSAPAAEEPVTPVGAACADVLEALTDAVIRYEMTALAEASGSGSRSVAAAEMLALIERARAAAHSQAGVPSAAAPAINSVIALRAGLDTLATLDEDDAAPWRGPRDDLQAWCSAQG
jgi:hypothetical protein